MKKIFASILCLVVLLGVTVNTSAQTRSVRKPTIVAPPPAQPVSSELTVADIVAMVKAQFSESLVLANIKSNGKIFRLSVAQQLELKNAGATEAIIFAMMGVVAPKTETKSESPHATTPKSDVSIVVEEVGFHFVDNGRALRLEPHTFAEQRGDLKGGIKRLVTLKGIGTDIKGVLDKPTSQFRVKDRRPEFILYTFEGSAPSDYQLLRLESKSDHREVTVAKILPSLIGKGRTKAQVPEDKVPHGGARKSPLFI